MPKNYLFGKGQARTTEQTDKKRAYFERRADIARRLAEAKEIQMMKNVECPKCGGDVAGPGRDRCYRCRSCQWFGLVPNRRRTEDRCYFNFTHTSRDKDASLALEELVPSLGIIAHPCCEDCYQYALNADGGELLFLGFIFVWDEAKPMGHNGHGPDCPTDVTRRQS